MLLPGHERELLAGRAYPLMTSTPDAVTDDDMNEFVRTYARPNARRGTEGLYQALFSDNGATKALADAHPIAASVLTLDGASYPFTENTFRQVAAGEITP